VDEARPLQPSFHAVAPPSCEGGYFARPRSRARKSVDDARPLQPLLQAVAPPSYEGGYVA